MQIYFRMNACLFVVFAVLFLYKVKMTESL